MMAETTHETLGMAPSKTQLLRCFQIDQAAKIMMEFKPFWTWPSTLELAAAHQSKKEVVVYVAKIWRLKCCKTLNQTCREKTHTTSKWSIVSSTWSQSGQAAGWGRPFLAKRSAVQHLLSAAVHKKNLHLPSAQLFQILSQGPKLVTPMNKAS